MLRKGGWDVIGVHINEGVSVLVALLLLSGLQSVILVVAWQTLGRSRHALAWALAFALETMEWAILLVRPLVKGGIGLYPLAGAVCVVASGLIAAGFYERAGRHAYRAPLLGAAIVAMGIVISIRLIAPEDSFARASPLLFRGLVLAVAATVIVPPGRRASAAEQSMRAMLWLFVLYNFAVVGTAIAFAGRTDWVGDLDRWLLLLGLPAAFAGTGLFIVFLMAADLAERMSNLAASDPLTGALNRRGFEAAALRAIANAHRHDIPLALAVADLDRFKAVNDEHGHAVGDAVLRNFADKVGDAVRRGDVFGRLGGEEFALLLVNSPGDKARTVIDRLRADLAGHSLSTSPEVMVTTSFGVAELGRHDTLDTLLDRADRALYQSKQDGRNRVTLAPKGIV